jgi:hypothetical protein
VKVKHTFRLQLAILDLRITQYAIFNTQESCLPSLEKSRTVLKAWTFFWSGFLAKSQQVLADQSFYRTRPIFALEQHFLIFIHLLLY